MGAGQEGEPRRAANGLLQAQHRVRGDAGEERLGRLVPEATGEPRRRLERVHAEPGEPQCAAWFERDVERREEVRQEVAEVADKRAQEAAVGVAVGTQLLGGHLDIAGDDDRPAVVERVGDCRWWLDPAQAVALQPGFDEERRRPSEWVDRAAHVVDEARQRELGGPAPAADHGRALEHAHRATRAGERDRRSEPVRAAADDDRVEHGIAHVECSRSVIGGMYSPISVRTHQAPVLRRSFAVVNR